MLSWWPSIGESSVLVGSAIGLIWGVISTARRRQRCLKAAMPPVGQLPWFLLNAIGMGSQVTLATALGLMSLEGQIAPTLLWFLLAVSFLSFMAAICLGSVAEPRRAGQPVERPEPQVEPPAPTPLRKTA